MCTMGNPSATDLEDHLFIFCPNFCTVVGEFFCDTTEPMSRGNFIWVVFFFSSSQLVQLETEISSDIPYVSNVGSFIPRYLSEEQ